MMLIFLTPLLNYEIVQLAPNGEIIKSPASYLPEWPLLLIRSLPFGLN